MQFLDNFEKQCGTQASVKRLRDHSSYHAFMTKWSLPVYYQIRYNVCEVMSPAGLLCQGLIYSFILQYLSVFFFKLLLFVKLCQIFKMLFLHFICSWWKDFETINFQHWVSLVFYLRTPVVLSKLRVNPEVW